jgi:hypothetical protein
MLKNNMTTKECYKCKYILSSDQFDISLSGYHYKTCITCWSIQHHYKSDLCEYDKHVCIHGKQIRNCVDCKGSNICSHKRQRENCVLCDGSNICEHNKIRKNCIPCNGSNICEHKKHKGWCITCNYPNICFHGKRYINCNKCNPCPHNKQINRCLLCEPYKGLKYIVMNQMNKVLKPRNIKPTLRYLEDDGDIEDYFMLLTQLIKDTPYNWENHGTIWVIHHIDPLDNNLDDWELIQRLHWTNTKPLLKN